MDSVLEAGGLGLSIALLLSSPAVAEPLAARPGAWEMTVTATMEGNGIPAEALAKIPPEKRAEVEKMMAARAGKPNVSTVNTCVKKEDLEQDHFMRNDDPKCTVETTVRTSTRLVAIRTCQGPPPSKGTITFEAKSPESVTGLIDQQRTDGGKLRVDIRGRWLQASCDGVALGPKKP